MFDLKGKVRGRFAKQSNQSDDKSNKKSKKKGKKKTVASGSDSEFSSDDDVETGVTYRDSDDEEGVAYSVGQDEPSSNGTGTPPEIKPSMSTLLDGDFLEFTGGRPLPLTDRAKTAFHFSVMNVSEHTIILTTCMCNSSLIWGMFLFILRIHCF